ncbi:MAG: ATP-binding protein [Desulfobulbus sp.]|nr:ATP-binding protein [Desulfobulbus sp.]
MKVRHRITLWVSLAGLVSSVILSLIVFFWGLDSPYEFLDQELEIRAHAVIDELTREQQAGGASDQATLDHFSHLYWIQIYNDQGALMYTSMMAKEISLPLHLGNSGYLIQTHIPLKRFYADEEEEHSAFWNRVFNIRVGNVGYRIHVARPVENLVVESIESAIMIGSSLLISTLILILVSYLVAGRILHPVQKIHRLTSDITENTLEKRIPLSGNRDELDELAVSLNAMFNRLQFSFQRQKEFVANASHELKTPLTLLRLSIEEILQDAQLPPMLQEKLLGQERALTRISQLVKGLLNLSRLELSDQLQRTTFSFNELVRSVLDEFQILLQEKQLSLECSLDGEFCLHADQEKLRRLLINLLDNAIRYNVPHGQIRCQAVLDDTTLLLTVANTGAEIGEQERCRVFEQFYRCEQSRATSHGGSGLGLTIVQRIVTLHGGDVAVVEAPSGWTTFAIRFPADCLQVNGK